MLQVNLSITTVQQYENVKITLLSKSLGNVDFF